MKDPCFLLLKSSLALHVYPVDLHSALVQLSFQPVATPRNDEWSRFVHTLGELKNQQAEDEDPGSISLSASPLR